MTMPQLYPHQATQEDSRDFLNEYSFLYNISAKRVSNHRGIAQADKVCRYCGRQTPEVKFKSKAHVFPKVFGKECDLISDSECNNCNNKHSLYETDLSRYLAVSRALRGELSRSNKPIKYDSDSILIEKGNVMSTDDNNEDVVTILDKVGQVISLNKENNEIIFTCRGESYRPINIFKLFLKVALGVLPFEEAVHYRYLITFLHTDKDDVLAKLAKVNITFSEHHVSLPSVVIFRRKQEEAKRILDVVQLSFRNIIVSFPLPFHSFDIENGLYENNLDIIVTPPLFEVEPHDSFWFDSEIKDFASLDQVTENLEFKMRFNYQAYEESMRRQYPELQNLNFDEMRIGAITFKPFK